MDITLTILGFIFIIGLIIGSFLNVVILRTVSGESIVFPASKCPKCQTPLKWYHNIPLFSYLFLRGKCAFCKEHISFQYPFVEFITGVFFVALFIKICSPFASITDLEFTNDISILQLVVYGFSLFVLGNFIALAGTDFIEKQVADVHLFTLIGSGIIFNLVYTILNHSKYFSNVDIHSIINSPIACSIIAAIIGFVIIEGIARLGEIIVKARTFGEGDSYIAAGIGSILTTFIMTTYFGATISEVLINLLIILALSVAIQVLITLPIFFQKLIKNKNWVCLSSISLFIIYSSAYYFGVNHDWLHNTIAYILSTLVLLALGLFTCRELLYGLKKNSPESGLYLPFGPAMLVAAMIEIFLLNLNY